jgi:hypothetical protein
MQEFDLETALSAISARNTDEMRLEQERASREIVEKLGDRLNPNSAENRAARAKEQEKAILMQIALLTSEPDSELKQNRLFQALNRLSELLAEQGKYTEAVEVCPDFQRREYYKFVSDAIDRPDDDFCDCPSDTYISDGKQRTSPAELKIDEIVVEGKTKSLYQCRKCGLKNAR